MGRSKYFQNQERDEFDELYRRLAVVNAQNTEFESLHNRRQTYGVAIEPEWENGFAQSDPPVEPFSYKISSSMHPVFTGHIDVSGAASGTIAFHVPVDPDETREDAVVIPHDVFDHIIVIDAAGTQFIGAMCRLTAATGAFTVTWPAS
jgi:hypothetical protein